MRLLVLLVLASIGLGPLPAWAQAVKVGAVVPLTGRYGAGGAQVRAGYEIAVEHLNAAGGVMVAGKKVPVELTLLDDESDALDGFEFLTMAEAAEVGHWQIVGKMNERANVPGLEELVQWVTPIQQRHFETTLQGSLKLAADEDPNETDG